MLNDDTGEIIKHRHNVRWKCKECGTICIATTNPTKGFFKWKDGHRCTFIRDEVEITH